MTYFNYHAKIKQKLTKGELTSYYFDSNYKKIGFCLVLCFANEKYPIREHRFEEYFEIIGKFYNTEYVDGVYYTISK